MFNQHKYYIMTDYNQPEYLDDTDPEKNLNYYRQDSGGMITNHNRH